MAFNWTCPYCNRPQSVTSAKSSTDDFVFQIEDTADGPIGLRASAIACSNPDCRKPEIKVAVLTAHHSNGTFYFHQPKVLMTKVIAPESSAKPQPEYIPAAIREDYVEACKILNLSPKASATLSRRCLQGMIRDFCGISKSRLVDEISELRKRVDSGSAPAGVATDTVDAIDHVRHVGNIGAHMEKDINHIVPVDPGEAQLLIELIETLFDEWYIARETRSRRLEDIKRLSEEKQMLISGMKTPS